MAKTVADCLVDRLLEWGVEVLFGYPGDGINGIFEALRTRQDKLRFIQVRHEEAAALAACGYAKYTGRLGVCLATSGPGGIHLLNGLYDAKCDSQPVLAITGHTFHDLIGTQYQQDIDLQKVFLDVAEFNEMVTSGTHLVNVLDQAIRVALHRRGVAHLTIPKDVQSQSLAAQTRSPPNIPRHSAVGDHVFSSSPSLAEIDAAASVLNRGERVAILVGSGCYEARRDLVAAAERLNAPIVKALLGKAVVPDDHPLTTGGLGLLGTSASYDVMKGCDTLLIAGSRFPYLEFYPEPGQARCVQIDLDGSSIGLRCPVEVALVGRCRDVLPELLTRLEPRTDRSFLDRAQASMRRWREILDERASRTETPLRPQFVTRRINDFLLDDAIVTTDCGTVTSWAARYIDIREGMRFSSSGLLATMGNALPYSVAAAIAFPGRQVVALSGDGGFSMLMAELATIVRYRLPVKMIVYRNDSLGMIKWEQMAMEGNPEFGCDLEPIDFVGVAQAHGALGFRVKQPDELMPALEEAFRSPGPALIEAHVDPNEPALPGYVTTDQAWNFAKAILRGEKDGWKILKNVVSNQVRETLT